jgi:hypothetical protein
MRNPRDTRRTPSAWAALCAIAAFLVAAPTAAAVDPAVEQYSLQFPNAKGNSHPGAEPPSARPSELSPLIRGALSDSRRSDGKALATVATAPELGAPEKGSQGISNAIKTRSGETPSFATAVWNAVGDVAVLLGLVAMLALIGFLVILSRGRTAEDQA